MYRWGHISCSACNSHGWGISARAHVRTCRPRASVSRELLGRLRSNLVCGLGASRASHNLWVESRGASARAHVRTPFRISGTNGRIMLKFGRHIISSALARSSPNMAPYWSLSVRILNQGFHSFFHRFRFSIVYKSKCFFIAKVVWATVSSVSPS